MHELKFVLFTKQDYKDKTTQDYNKLIILDLQPDIRVLPIPYPEVLRLHSCFDLFARQIENLHFKINFRWRENLNGRW